MENKRKITNKEKDIKKLSGRLIKLFKENGYDVENDCHAITRLVADMEKQGLNLNNAYKTIRSHVLDKSDIEITWLKNYCTFFHCSADYILGYINEPTHEKTDINSASGLSSAAIQKLLDNPEVKIVTDNLLRTNAIDYFIKALSVSVQIKHMDNFIANQIEKKKIPGVTKSDLELFRSNLDSGNRSQIESFAIVCFDNLLNKNLDDYFDDKATRRYLDNLDSDIKSQS